MWRWLMRAMRGARSGRAYEAQLIPIELADVLMHDAAYDHARRDLELRRAEAVRKHREEEAERYRVEHEARERAWREMLNEWKAQSADNVVPMRRAR